MKSHETLKSQLNELLNTFQLGPHNPALHPFLSRDACIYEGRQAESEGSSLVVMVIDNSCLECVRNMNQRDHIQRAPPTLS